MGFKDLVSDINTKYGNTITTGKIPPKERIPFSSPSLNYVTYGGICYQSSSELVGAETSGKSTLAIDLIRNFQVIEAKRYKARKEELEARLTKAKGKELDKINNELSSLTERVTVYLDLEASYDPIWATKLGINTENVTLVSPEAMGVEEPLDWIIKFSETPEVGFIVIDSIGAMISGAEDEKSLADSTYGGVSKVLTRFYKKITPNLKTNNIALLVINQIRDDMNNPYAQFNRPGGKMNKYAQSITIGLTGGQKLDDKYADATNKSDMVYARETNVQVIKNKTAPPDRQRTKFTIRFGHGVDRAYDVFTMACEFGLILVAGAYYTFSDPETGEVLDKVQGKANAINYIRKDKKLLEKLWLDLYNKSLVVEPEDEELEEEDIDESSDNASIQYIR